jgi:hypothetical protein
MDVDDDVQAGGVHGRDGVEQHAVDFFAPLSGEDDERCRVDGQADAVESRRSQRAELLGIARSGGLFEGRPLNVRTSLVIARPGEALGDVDRAIDFEARGLGLGRCRCQGERKNGECRR